MILYVYKIGLLVKKIIIEKLEKVKIVIGFGFICKNKFNVNVVYYLVIKFLIIL